MADPTVASPPVQPVSAAPSLECAVAIGRGLVDGLGCPPAVFETTATHRLRAIHGTSAGASAAAFVAAAEFGREQGGFEKLRGLDQWLADGDHLRQLFQPSPATRPLFTFLLALERRGRTGYAAAGIARLVAGFWGLFPAWVRIVFDVIPGALREALPMRYWIATVLGAGVGGAIDVLLARGIVDASHPLARTIVAIVLPVMFIGSYVAGFGACVSRLWSLASVELPQQLFGICTGMPTGSSAGPPALTDWMHARIQDLAGLPIEGPPLTVGALRTKHLEDGGSEAGIEFHIVTAGRSMGGVHRSSGRGEPLTFREADMRRLFPGTIVDHLLAHARPAGHEDPGLEDCHGLPAPEDMPVLVLARMSMTLPTMLSAVPLGVAGSAAGMDQAECVRIEADGLRSGFPLNLLLAWLPVRPDFAIRFGGLEQLAGTGPGRTCISSSEAGELERIRECELAAGGTFFTLV